MFETANLMWALNWTNIMQVPHIIVFDKLQ